MTESIRLDVIDVRKEFNRRVVFDHITFTLSARESLAVTGKNGSGKSTLVKITAGLLSATAGRVRLVLDGIEVKPEDHRKYLGFVAPYLQLYDEFTGYENLEFAARIRGANAAPGRIEQLLSRVGLLRWKNDQLGTYSSGMKQRLKYAFALLHRPGVLILDEPMTNLDHEGIDFVREVIEEQKKSGILIVATNDAAEAQNCELNLDLNTMRLSSAVIPLASSSKF